MKFWDLCVSMKIFKSVSLFTMPIVDVISSPLYLKSLPKSSKDLANFSMLNLTNLILASSDSCILFSTGLYYVSNCSIVTFNLFKHL